MNLFNIQLGDLLVKAHTMYATWSSLIYCSICSMAYQLFMGYLIQKFDSLVFVNVVGEWGSIPGRVIPKILKMVLDTSLLKTQHHKIHIEGRVEQSRKGVVPSPTPWCSSY